MPDARTDILARIRAGNAAAHAATVPLDHLRPDYIRAGTLDRPAVIELLVDRLHEYDAGVFRSTAADVPATIARALAERGKANMLAPDGLPAEWLVVGTTWTVDAATRSPADLDAFDGVLTDATVAIAATGTIVLQHGSGQGRRMLTLVPDYHLCVVRADQVVETVPEAFARLDPVRPTTTISGPSATADIEMTRIKGVHGPRFLDVILVG
jgi:L-lactate dehydrogenase complex protein LldG